MENNSPAFSVLKVIGSILIVLVVIVALGVGLLTILEYKPAPEEPIEPIHAAKGKDSISTDDELTIMTWNMGYCGLSETADFFMDGGKSVVTQDEDSVKNNLLNIERIVAENDPDVVYLQEIDKDSTRSFGINQVKDFTENAFPDNSSSYATNFKVLFIPYPIPPIGHMDCGILTSSKYDIAESTRVSLPCPFSWPVRTMNLKRCLDISRVPVKDSDREFVFINLHLEAYDDGEGKIAQTRQLAEIMQAEYDKGNYVIAGGDFNQTFSSVDTSMYPPRGEELWQCGIIDESQFGDNFSFVMDNSNPSCRSLDRAYDSSDPNFQVYLIDGFIVSDNLKVDSVETLDYGFKYTDHNPVKMTVSFKNEK
ncbi:MAG: endonuclease/exonuclease/phosphatase family protein [Lachnospiraceae bacterium]|nr:endonuclease/exonuclease/phosphatase family protein [Lachnospiraceae bacterium]